MFDQMGAVLGSKLCFKIKIKLRKRRKKTREKTENTKILLFKAANYQIKRDNICRSLKCYVPNTTLNKLQTLLLNHFFPSSLIRDQSSFTQTQWNWICWKWTWASQRFKPICFIQDETLQHRTQHDTSTAWRPGPAAQLWGDLNIWSWSRKRGTNWGRKWRVTGKKTGER